MNQIILYVALGLAAGVLSGLLGIGGGIILIPAFVYMLGLSQQSAQGTTLALMVPPIGLLAAWAYYKQGHVVLPVALFVCIGFFVGGFFGAKIAGHLSNQLLQKLFGGLLLVISLRMLFFK
ncbi:MAG: TSUP family transporter [Candidatus Omnitrophota bacterium]